MDPATIRRNRILERMSKQDTSRWREAEPKKKKRKSSKSSTPTEYEEQRSFCRWLDERGVRYTAIPNGSHLAGDEQARYRQSAKLKASGVKPGFPDLLIFLPGRVVAVEMKRADRGRLSKAQKFWLDELAIVGVVTIVAHGVDEAIMGLREIAIELWGASP